MPWVSFCDVCGERVSDDYSRGIAFIKVGNCCIMVTFHKPYDYAHLDLGEITKIDILCKTCMEKFLKLGEIFTKPL